MIKAYIIRLAGAELSERLANECIEAGTKYGQEIIPFGGINGHVADSILQSLGLFPFKQKSKASKPGVKGCFLSHYMLWKKCTELNEPIAIFEHDGMLLRPIPEDILDKFDDVLNLDACDQFSKTYEYCLNQEGPVIVQEYHNQKFKPGTLWGEYLRGAYAYIIKPHAADKIIKHCHSHGFLPADHQIGKNLVHIQATFPSIARLHPYYLEDDNIKSASYTKHGPPAPLQKK